MIVLLDFSSCAYSLKFGNKHHFARAIFNSKITHIGINGHHTSISDVKDRMTDSCDGNRGHSFVHDELRAHAMKLHSKDQTREGEQTPQIPLVDWQPTRQMYLQFLVDSLEVHRTIEEIVNQHSDLLELQSSKLERAKSLIDDIEWLLKFDSTLKLPACGKPGDEYASFLSAVAEESVPKFICHYYNYYFAHSAGGRAIGKQMSLKLLSDKELKFYQWDGDVRELLEAVRLKIDRMAEGWSEEQRQQCVQETSACFRYAGGLMRSIRPPMLEGM